MSESKPASKQTVALLGVGSAAALGAAYWSISSALAPPPASATSHPAAQTQTSSAATDLTASLAAVQSSDSARSPQPITIPSAPEDQANARARDFRGARPSAASEAFLKPEADPFVPLHPQPQSGTVSVQNTAAGSQRIGSQSSRQVAPITGTLAKDSSLHGPLAFDRPVLQPISVPEPVAPELVGTLLGETPNAVFRGDAQFVAVPVGGSFGGWKVVGVRQGEAVLKRKGQLVVLQTGAPSPLAVGPDRYAGLTDTPVRAASPLAEAASRSAFTEPRFARGSRAVKRPPLAPAENQTSQGEEPSVALSVADSITNGSALAVVASTRPDTSVQTPDSLPELPDTPLTPEGISTARPSDAGVSRQSERTTTSDTVGFAAKDDSLITLKPIRPGAVRTAAPAPVSLAAPDGYRRFQRLVSRTGNYGFGPVLTVKA